MAITYKSITAVLSRLGTTTFTLDATTEFVIVVAGAANNSGTSDLVCTAGNISSDAGVNVLTLQVDRTEGDTLNSLGRNVSLLSGKVSNASPGALNTGASACTLSLTFNNTLSAGTWAAYVIQCDMGASASHPYKSSEYIFSDTNLDPFNAFASMAVTSGGMALTFSYHHLGTGIAQNTSDGFTERADTTSFGGLRSQVQTKNLSGSENLALVLDPSTGSRYQALQAWYQEVNDPAITDVDTLPATPGEALTVTGTALDVVGTGIRLRDVASPSLYETLAVSGVTSSSLTATMPAMLTEVPFTVGTSATCEAIATLSGTPSGAAFSVSVDVESGWAVVELSTPNLTASQSLAGNLPFTAVDVDQLYYNTLSGDITVDPTGVPTADVGYVAGTEFEFYGWDASAGSGRWVGPFSAQITDDGDVVIGDPGTGTGGPVRSPIRSPIRSAVRGTIH